MWKAQLDPVYQQAAGAAAAEESKGAAASTGTKGAWYQGSVQYWDNQPATIDGVLGGYEAIHETESDTSIQMINQFKHLLPSMGSALDCGAGIGRITKRVLKPLFSQVDLVEPSSVQLNQAREYVPEARNFYLKGLQEFNYEHRYDCIWI